jgi:adenylate kinase
VNLLVLGPQGSGKGTQAAVLAAIHGIPHVSTGDMFRAAIADETELGLRVKAIIEAGELVPDELTTELVQQRLSAPDAAGGFVLDGYPRNLGQAEALAAWLDVVGRSLDAVLFFDLNDEIATERALGRAAASGRTDDTPEVIARRLELYHQETEPVVAFYRASGVLVSLHAERSIDEVTEEIEAALELIGEGRAA